MKKISVLFMVLLLSLSFSLGVYGEEGQGDSDPYSGVGAYMGFFQVQTSSWVYRNPFDDPNTGYGSDIFETVYNNETDAATSTIIEDTLIDGDGLYKVSLLEADFEGSTDFNMVALSTNLPLDGSIAISDVSLHIGGRTITKDYAQKNDEKDYIMMMLINQYDSDMKDTVNNMVPPAGTDMWIEFTVSGFGYDKAPEEPEEVLEESNQEGSGGDQAVLETEEVVDEVETEVSDGTVENDLGQEEADAWESQDQLPVYIPVIGVLALAGLGLLVFIKKK